MPEEKFIDQNEQVFELLEQKLSTDLNYAKLTNEMLFYKTVKFNSNWSNLVTSLQRAVKDVLDSYKGTPIVSF